MELTEKLLVSLGGWDAMKRARAIKAAGAVLSASYEPPMLTGRLAEGGREFRCGLRLRNPVDIENLCPCADSRRRGMVCAHSMAVGLEVLSPTQKQTPVPSPAPRSAPGPTTNEIPRVTLSLEGSLRHLEAAISFDYSTPDAKNPAAEAAALLRLVRCGFEDDKGRAVLRGEDAIVRFFASALPRLQHDWKVVEGERFQHVTKDIVRFEPRFAIRERGDGWLDFHVHFTAGRDAVLSSQDLQRLLQSGKPQLRLADGRLAIPDADMAADLEEVLRDCNPTAERGGYRVDSRQRGYLETSIAEWSAKPGPEPVSSVSENNLGPLREKLRPYQIEGALWLLRRAKDGTAGLLADEMGLGKTIQTLALFESLPGPHLVVCPSTLVWNWHREAARFTPALKSLQIHGPDRERLFAQIPAHDLVITSYALLRRDLERLQAHDFATVVLDEAQHIKNPDSQNAKAAGALRSRARFILTGTPLENSVRDLWSLFDFLLPGHLGTRKDFQERYEKPIQSGDTTGTWPRLVRRVKPWMLRRTKSEILTELPEKIEQVVEVELTPDQKAAYTQLQIAARAEVDALRDSAGAARMKVLTALLRLRQASCDLRLLGKDSPAPSGKIDALLELLGEAVDGGHRTLVFSQFTSMLDLIGPALDEAGISWTRLDGSTKDRAAVVDAFQNDPAISVLLISLKAGGTGLNLTAADTVIHFDPWWNPAVEAQATDRAHRIGQKNVVTSIKLVARDTVEQRVLEMQEKKRTLLTELLDPASAPDPATPGLENADLIQLIG
jgi:superfamily II DNA or RNA helicase